MQGVGFEMLIVCGFAFDPHVAEEAKRYGNLTVLPAKMNPDLAMGDELLKKTGAGNLFMVFGEPYVEIRKQENGQIVAEIKGMYDRPPDRFAVPRPATSPAGSSIPTTTARAFSSVTRISPARMIPTTNSSGCCGPTSTKQRGAVSTAR